MCGIAGLVARGESGCRPNEGILGQMSLAIAHRGPDGAATWLDPTGRAGFAHRRLAIVDLSPEAGEPMLDASGRYCLVFNGEIYNHRKLRSELDALSPVPWRTDHSDTEVLLQAFRFWGLGCLERIEGMFAFAIWDTKNSELWLVRDRLGVKPLYFAITPGHLAFASEIKALLAVPGQARQIDEEAVFHYLSFLVAPAPMTMYKGIQKLPPGSWLHLGRGGAVQVERWWDPLDNTTPNPAVTHAEACDLVLEELRRSVELRKMSDVPVGVFLSGGVDSTTNAVLFSQGEQAPVRTFTTGYTPDAASYPSELPNARLVTELLGAERHELILGVDDLIAFLPKMGLAQDEPLADPVCFPLYHLARLARESGTPVVQVGEGADEIFAGYPRWHEMLRLQRLASAMPAGRLSVGAVHLAAPLLDAGSFRYEYARRAAGGLPVFWGGAEGFGDEHKRSLMGAGLRARFAGASSWDVLAPIRQDFLDKAWDRSDLSWMTYLDLRLRLPELLLMRVDKMTMAWGVEARVPFLDPRLVTKVLGLPPSVRLGHSPKGLLKAAVRGIVPDEVIDRRKQGFGVPVADWMAGPLGTTATATLDRFCRETDLLDAGAVHKLLAGPRRDQAWYLLNLALWWEAQEAN